MRTLVMVACAVSLAACSSPPKPPTVSGRHRIPINSPAAQEELRLQVFPQEPTAQATMWPARPPKQTVNVYFPQDVTVFRPTSAQINQLHTLLWPVPKHINVRGLTDNSCPPPGDTQVARVRALAIYNWLINQGVPASRITISYAPVKDYASNAPLSPGRVLNRRVDIEILRK
ncbi:MULTISPECIES: OmpA family protein [Brucella]|uniref:Type IV secretion system putative outer membrane lipoprotein BMEII0036 n=5 Tax=Brucella melitensis TaxID=29459 RepID=YU36_BRUME|nr:MULTISPECIES: OmpA family protein [Brucella]Q8YDY8.1 RecName: Full=Type IV secretion system putative outer membrane lipoprotein BMEII0036; Flags: Precursor [Brucella melitensis bv. 1 str. 16M]EPZ76553.1 type VI secretion protein [Brucella melitensis ADMAS-G1]AAL53277.1 outer membrane protein oprf [Brucella melitensis bv. 1 str. 16M]ACO01943.1 TraQ protein [Brucella melitensis ATCC 23457]AEQ09765.1 TraQ protein [Brucella melitensis NI]AIJ87312.1 ompA family protein [Brucella melitensis bv. 